MADRRNRLRRRITDFVSQVRPSSFSRRKPRFPGELRRIGNFESTVLGSGRELVVYLPPGYENDVGRRYPVLYMHDGQNLFDPRTAFVKGMHWRIGETLGTMIKARTVAPLIVVGIFNSGDQRIDEYTPTRDPEKKRGGDADRYGQMILTELKPRIDRDYRTQPQRENTGIAGSSLGGLVSVYLGLKHPDVFGRLGILSPSVWWDDKTIIDIVESFQAAERPRIWLDVGTAEGDAAVKNARHLGEALIKKGWRPGEDLLYVEIPGAEHNERAWGRRIGDALRFLFPPS